METDKEFKEMLSHLRKQQNQQSVYEKILRNENNLLEMELMQCKNENSFLIADNISKIEEIVNIKSDVETFMKKEAITFMKIFKQSCKDKEVTDEMQLHINNFIYKLKHCLFLSKRS